MLNLDYADGLSALASHDDSDSESNRASDALKNLGIITDYGYRPDEPRYQIGFD